MLTKEERAAIAERLSSVTKLGDRAFYEAITGEQRPNTTSYEEDLKAMSNVVINLCDTSNMVELPLDKDGEVIKVGDIVSNKDGKETEVTRVELAGNNWLIDIDIQYPFFPQELTHKKPVANELFIEQIRHVIDKGQMSAWSMAELFSVVEQLEKLGDSND